MIWIQNHAGNIASIITSEVLLSCAGPLPVTVDVQAYDLIKYHSLKKHIDEVVKILFTKEDLTRKTL